MAKDIREVRDAVRLLTADTPVTCGRCDRSTFIAADEFEEWPWSAAAGFVCSLCATAEEREAHEALPTVKARRLLEAARRLAEDESSWTEADRRASEQRIREILMLISAE
jgi:hypothetical protein